MSGQLKLELTDIVARQIEPVLDLLVHYLKTTEETCPVVEPAARMLKDGIDSLYRAGELINDIGTLEFISNRNHGRFGFGPDPLYKAAFRQRPGTASNDLAPAA